MNHHPHALVACARWEETHIVEWIEYHRSIGFDHVYLYSNDDDPDTLKNVLLPYLSGQSPYVTYRHFPYVGRQPEIYLHFLENYQHQVDWFCFLDIDEFITLPGLHDVARFVAGFAEDWDCIYLNWILFGHAGRQTRAAGSVLLQYTQRAATIDPHTKNLVRAGVVEAADVRARFALAPQAFWHFWGALQIPGLRICNVLGENAADYSDQWPRRGEGFANRLGITEAVLSRGYVSHYIFKSEEDFLRRAARGEFGSFAAQGEWARMYHEGGHRALLDRLNAMPDRLLADYWRTWLDRLEPIGIIAPPDHPNIGLGKPARQSSVFEGLDAAGGNNGHKTGHAGFHTRLEGGPWWAVDLLGPYSLSEIRLYNRIDDPACAARAAHLLVEVSQDGALWTTLHAQVAPFGGVDGQPLLIRLDPGMPARQVRVRLATTNFLHLDEVEIYGLALDQD